MKRFISIILAGAYTCFAILLIVFGLLGCQSAAQNASKANATLITTVNGAMTGWGAYTRSNTNMPASEILAVSNAYNAYYQSELTLSNLSAAYVANPTTNAAAALSIAATALSQSVTNLTSIIGSLSATNN